LFFHQKEVVEKELETSQTLLIEKLKRAIKGNDLFQDTKVNHWKVEFDIVGVKHELVDVQKQQLVVAKLLETWKGEGGHLFGQSQCYIHLSMWTLIPPLSLCSRHVGFANLGITITIFQ